MLREMICLSIVLVVALMSTIALLQISDANMITSREMNALYDFYTELNGERWAWSDDTVAAGISWNFTNNSDPCADRWQGIHCTCMENNNASCHIEEINLVHYNLVGSIPSSLSNLSYLQALQLADNSISGVLDSNLWNLSLIELALANNLITGSIPDSLCGLLNLKMFTISGTTITGTLPTCIGDLTEMDTFTLTQVSIEGVIPESVCNWNKIRDFSVYAYNFDADSNFPLSCFGSGGTLEHFSIINLPVQANNEPLWPAICDNHNLISFQAAYGGLTGSLPSGCFSHVNMPNLTFLDVQGNYLTGHVLSELLHDLLVLNVSSNHLNGTLSVDGLTGSRLQTLIAANNFLAGSLPTVLNTTNISSFLISNNHFSGSLPSLCNWETLQEFRINTNHMTGTLHNCIGSSWTSLTDIDISDNKFTGTLPESICEGWSKLIGVNILNTLLTGSISKCVGNFKDLLFFSINDNRFGGSLSDTICEWKKLIAFNIKDNYFTGSLPSCVGNWTESTVVILDNNMFTGSFPDGICSWKLVNYFSTNTNFITGNLPYCMGNMTSSFQLYLTDNLLNGTLPESICEWPNIGYIQLYQNLLSGSLPECLSNWIHLYHFYMWRNEFTGTISDHWCYNHLHLGIFDIWGNNLHGTLPPCIWTVNPSFELIAVEENYLTGPFFLSENISCGSKQSPYTTHLGYITANGNHFTGQIPSCIDRLFPLLENLDLGGNQMNGTIPNTLCKLMKLYDLQVYDNYFTGTLPDCWNTSRFFHLEQISVGDNYLTGTLPTSVCNLIHLNSLLIGGNQFIGSIPDCYGVNMTAMMYFNVSSSHLTGTLSDALCGMYNSTVFFAVNNNQLRGSIPACLGSFEKLQYLFLSSNVFTGSLSFLRYSHGASQLNELSIEHNQFTGKLFEDLAYATFNGGRKKERRFTEILAQQNLFTGSLPTADWEQRYNMSLFDAFGSLLILDVAENKLTGSIDAALFTAAKELNSMVLIKNCFSGLLRENLSLCGESHLEVLALDGLSANCRNTKNNAMQGSIPTCLFALPALRVFHAAGNNFIGSLPDDLSSNLTDLSLSHNDLGGTIPANMQRRVWINLDLAYNKLEGSLVDSGGNNSQWTVPGRRVRLGRNRLSGDVPSQYLHAKDVDILNGNLFSCQLDAIHKLPANDPYANSYSCGTDSLNLMLIVGGGLILISLLVLLVWMISSRSSHHSNRKAAADGSNENNIESQVMGEEEGDESAPAVLGAGRSSINEEDEISCQDITVSYTLSSQRRDQFYLPSPSAASHISSAEDELESGLDTKTGNHSFRIKTKSTARLRREEFPDAKIDDDDSIVFPVAPTLKLPNFPFMQTMTRSSDNITRHNTPVNISTRNNNTNHTVRNNNNNRSNTSADRRMSCYQRIITSTNELKDRCIGSMQLLQTDWQRIFYSAPQSAMEEEQLRTSLPAFHAAPSDSLARFLQVCDHQRRLYTTIGTFSLCVALPLFALLSVYYQTHSSTYAWVISAAYIGGIIPAVVLLSLWITLLVWLYHALDPNLRYHNSRGIAMRKIWLQIYQIFAFWQDYSIIALALLLNALLILLINGVYVYVVVHNSRAVSIPLQIALVAFKLFYNGRVVSKLIRGSEWLHHLRKRQRLLKKGILAAVLQDDGSGVAAGGGGGGGESLISSDIDTISGFYYSEGLIPGIYSEAALVVFNLVIVPIIASICVDTNCFYELLVPPQPLQTPLTITSSTPSYRFFWTSYIATFSSTFVAVETVLQTEFIPPFTYSGQCASSIIATYEPVFVLLLLANLFLLPLMRLVQRMYRKQKQQQQRRVAAVIDDTDGRSSRRRHRQNALTELLTGIPLKPELLRSLSFDRRSFVVSRVTNMSILLTFGWVFPPLAILIALVEIRDSIYIVATLQQYIIDLGSMQEAEKDLGWHVKGIASSLPYLQIRYLQLGAICLGFLLYDIAADQQGLVVALWVPLSMGLAPCLINQACLMWQRRSSKSGQQQRVDGVYIATDMDPSQ